MYLPPLLDPKLSEVRAVPSSSLCSQHLWQCMAQGVIQKIFMKNEWAEWLSLHTWWVVPHSLLKIFLVNDTDSLQEHLDRNQKIRFLILAPSLVTYVVLDKSLDPSLNLSFLLSFFFFLSFLVELLMGIKWNHECENDFKMKSATVI